MRITVHDARTLAAALTAAADEAMSKGDFEFEFTHALQKEDDAARADLQQAIDEQKS